MYKHQIYSSGVHGALKVRWDLICKTPLAVRNGLDIIYKDGALRKSKSRGIKVNYAWQHPSDNELEVAVATLHYGYEVKDNSISAYHFVPPSSIRGALRSWTISNLISPQYHNKMSPPSKTDEQETANYIENLGHALSDENSGYHLIASLFGLAFDSRSGDEIQSNEGRLSIEISRFSSSSTPQPISTNGTLDNTGLAGPKNARRQMTVRNPLDRMTHASKEGGLHHFLEFCADETFSIFMTILNPQESDLGLLGLWRREIEYGLLRFGALASIGRGRVSIQNQSYDLCLDPIWEQLDWVKDRFSETNESTTNDALAGLWKVYTVPPASLDQFISNLE